MPQEPQAFKSHVRRVLAGRSRRSLDDPALTCAAVLLPLAFKDGAWHVVVTQRTRNVEHHKGQISLPGGACEPHDADLLATALRETHEEIGVPPQAVEVLGALDELPAITHFSVAPFVGVIPHPFAYHLNPAEVEAAVEVPLTFLREPTHLRVEQWERDGQVHDVLFWDFGPYTIWGLTARIIHSFLELVC